MYGVGQSVIQLVSVGRPVHLTRTLLICPSCASTNVMLVGRTAGRYGVIQTVLAGSVSRSAHKTRMIQLIQLTSHNNPSLAVRTVLYQIRLLVDATK